MRNVERATKKHLYHIEQAFKRLKYDLHYRVTYEIVEDENNKLVINYKIDNINKTTVLKHSELRTIEMIYERIKN